ncbi:hypothetical protein BDW75DRAFT_234351 [Aspergillus navahoensis]
MQNPLQYFYLCFDRVFLSANPLKIAVFCAIADSEIFRHSVNETIWDDARFIKAPFGEFHITDSREDLWINEDSGCPYWFVNALPTIEQLILAEEQLAAELPLKISWQHYQNLLQQQEDIILQNKDAQALEYGLRRFPALKSFTPLYETRLIRAFPKGFNYPIPRGWPRAPINRTYKPTAQPWEDKAVKKDSRGFGIVTRALAQYPEYRVSELIIDAHTLESGLNCYIFREPNPEYNDFAIILRRPGFARLDLSLRVRDQEHRGWPGFRSGYLRRVFAGADGLEHMSLSTDVEEDPAPTAPFQEAPGARATRPPTRSFPSRYMEVPPPLWTVRLPGRQRRHRFISSAPPPTNCSVNLDMLYFVDHGGSYRELLEDMGDKLDWRMSGPASRPVVSIAKPTFKLREFLYRDR